MIRLDPARLCLAAVLLMGCKEQEFGVTDIPQALGDLSLSGRVCDPDTQTWLSDALVYTHLYDENDVVYDTRTAVTDADGRYVLTHLIGGMNYQLFVQKGQDIIDESIVTMPDDLDLVQPDPSCFGDVAMSTVVITGAYDSLVPMLQSMGLSGIYEVDGQVGDVLVDFLSDPANLADYDAVFFDGGHKEDGVIYGDGPVDTIKSTLTAYVEGGGLLYTSDWAYDVVEQTWPQRIDFLGEDSTPDAAQQGEVGLIDAAIEDLPTQQATGIARIDIDYDKSVWPVIESVDDGTVYFSGDVEYRSGDSVSTLDQAPLLAGFSVGQGRVLVSTFRASANDSGEMRKVLGYLITGE